MPNPAYPGYRTMTAAQRYTIREARPDGSIDTIGEFQQFGTIAAARAHVLMEDPRAVAA